MLIASQWTCTSDAVEVYFSIPLSTLQYRENCSHCETPIILKVPLFKGNPSAKCPTCVSKTVLNCALQLQNCPTKCKRCMIYLSSTERIDLAEMRMRAWGFCCVINVSTITTWQTSCRCWIDGSSASPVKGNFTLNMCLLKILPFYFDTITFRLGHASRFPVRYFLANL